MRNIGFMLLLITAIVCFVPNARFSQAVHNPEYAVSIIPYLIDDNSTALVVIVACLVMILALIAQRKYLAYRASEKHLKQAIYQTQQQQRAILDNIPDIAWLKDRDSRFVDVNEALARTCKKRRDEIIGRTDLDFYPKEIAEAYRANDLEVMRSGKPLSIEEPYIGEDGATHYIETSKTPIFDSDHNVIGTCGIARDITERKLADEELRQSQERISAILNAVNASILIIDAKTHQIIHANPAAASMARTTVEEMIGKVCHEFVCPAQVGACPISDLGQKCDHSEKIMLRADGSQVSILKSVTPINLSGRDYFIETAVDITDRKHAEDELVRAKEHAEEANKAKSQFLANTSHEIRTPMNSILGFAELLKQENLTEEQRDYVNMIYSSGENLLAIINDILNLSKIEAGRVEIRPADISIRELIDSVLGTVKLAAQKKGLVLNYKLDPELPDVIRCDTDKLRQVLINLLGNSVKFTDKGYVTLIAEQVNASPEPSCGGVISFCVEDSGIGIAAQDQKRVFEAFTQIDGTDTRSHQGTGLGLTISQKFVKLLGGNLEISSESGKGSKFYFSIPYRTAMHAYPENKHYVKSKTEQTIFIVEDDDGCRKLFKTHLRKRGFEVITHDEGSHAVELITGHQPDAVVLDINLPQKNGLEILKELKAQDSTKNIPVIICSVMTDVQKSFNLGALEHLIKPIEGTKLVETVSRALGGIKEQSRILVIDDDPVMLESIRTILDKFEVICADSGSKGIECLRGQNGFDLTMVDLMMPQVNGFEVIEVIRKDISKKMPIIVITAKDLSTNERDRLDGQVQAICKKSDLTPDLLIGEIESQLSTKLVNTGQKPPSPSVAHKILLADDVQENRMLLEIILKKAGYQVISCANGKEAVDLAAREKFDLILMDMQMPVMNGYDATRLIKASSINKSTPVIAITANAMKGDNLSCMEAGCDDYISKPVKQDILLEKLAKFSMQSAANLEALGGGEIISQFADNSEYHKAIELFVNNLSGRICDMVNAFDKGNLEDLAQKVHSLKGLGGLAGFPIYTQKAKQIEGLLADKKIDSIKAQLDELVELCSRTQALNQTGSQA